MVPPNSLFRPRGMSDRHVCCTVFVSTRAAPPGLGSASELYNPDKVKQMVAERDPSTSTALNLPSLAAYRQLLDAARATQDAVMLLDNSGTILFANQRAWDGLLPSGASLNGTALNSLLGENHPLAATVTATIASGAEVHNHILQVADDASCLVTILQVGSSAGPASWLVSTRDLKALLELQTTVEKANRQARLVGVISSVTHQLRSPLQGMKLRLELLAADTGEDKHRHIERLKGEIARLDQSVELLLRFLRPQDLKITEFDINEMLRELGEQQANERVRTVFELEPLPPVRADRMILSEALDSIITNAIQAMPDGGVLTLQSSRKGELFELAVIDTGVGMQEDQLTQVFDLYYTTKPHAKGIGLSFALRGIELNRGTIEINSQVGKGTVCRIQLPDAAD